MTTKEIYKAYNIEYKNGKILSPVFGFIAPFLKKGNSKVGENVYTWSTLPTNQIFHVIINGKSFDIKGTCNCHCIGCYATKGFYNMPGVVKSMAINTVLIRDYPEFVQNAIIAQIKAENLKTVRIDAAGDIENSFISVFRKVAAECNDVIFWTYTKNKAAENAFDDIPNFNIVKSVIPGIGINYGYCDHVLKAYNELKAHGENVYICRCGIDKNQHCENCKACQNNKYVLFIEHSTEYKAEKDKLFPVLKEVIENQPKQ